MRPSSSTPAASANSWSWKKADLLVAALLIVWIIFLHTQFLSHAGPLWRDEIGTIDFASMPTWSQIWHNLQYDNFPPLFVGMARLWTALGLSSDFDYRCLGLLVGLATLAVFWYGGKRCGAAAPLLVLALYAANPLAVRVGDAMRPYGVGIACNVLALLLTFRFVENPRWQSWAWATLAAVVSVQCLYQNAVFVAAWCLAGCILAARRRQWKVAAQTVGIGTVAAVSLLPHLGNIMKGRDWLDTARHIVAFGEIQKSAAAAANEPASWMAWLWIALVLIALGVAARACLRSSLAVGNRALFFGVATVAGVAFFGLFIARVSLKLQPWYFLDLLAPVAMAIDIIIAANPDLRVRITRTGLAIAVILATAVPCASKVTLRQTNADLVASTLRQHSGPQDVIVVSPWYYGVALQRYYTNHFDTIPPMAELRIHRYDLMKKAMLTENPIGPLLAQARKTLQSGGTLWVVGDFQFPPPGMPQPLLPPYVEESNMDIPAAHYFSSWMFQFSQMVQAHATSMGQADIPVPGGGPVSPLENMPVFLFRGWKE